mmetsp:Transcript_13337/g.27861  ORF Transcript_13337/g.27861 Transcript_13337/m.27861 type:complete len:112 (-) Transcript_13337:71-406(-)
MSGASHDGLPKQDLRRKHVAGVAGGLSRDGPRMPSQCATKSPSQEQFARQMERIIAGTAVYTETPVHERVMRGLKHIPPIEPTRSQEPPSVLKPRPLEEKRDDQEKKRPQP